MGGQTALNLAMEAEKKGILKKYKTLFGEQASQILSVYEHKHDHVHSDKGEIKKN